MEKILIVEDDPLMYRMYQKVFTLEHFSPIMAKDGEEGLQTAKQELPAIILLDIMMPKMNGLEVLSKLKEDPKTKNIPVVMLSNLAGPQDTEQAIAKGAVRYIIKSEYEPDQVVTIVQEILKKHKQTTPASS